MLGKVCGHLLFSIELLGASLHWADEPFILGVPPLMIVQVAPIFEKSRTIPAFKRILIDVFSDVCIKSTEL